MAEEGMVWGRWGTSDHDYKKPTGPSVVPLLVIQKRPHAHSRPYLAAPADSSFLVRLLCSQIWQGQNSSVHFFIITWQCFLKTPSFTNKAMATRDVSWQLKDWCMLYLRGSEKAGKTKGHHTYKPAHARAFCVCLGHTDFLFYSFFDHF